MPDKWDANEEAILIKEISKGIDLKEIAEKHKRSYNAVELRVKKIIYDNMNETNGKDHEGKALKLSKIFKLQPDIIKQYYKDFKIFLERKSEAKEKIDKTNEAKSENNSMGPITKKSKDTNKNISLLREQNDKLRTIIDNIKLKEEFATLMKKKKLKIKKQLKIFRK